MRITRLAQNLRTYSSNAYLVRGDRNTLDDVNTLIDTGVDKSVVDAVRAVYTGVGKKAVDQVILTHGHFDHVGGAEAIQRDFGAVILRFGNHPPVDRILTSGENLRIGDRDFTVIPCVEHSQDSILLFEPEDGVLFSGDTPLDIKSEGGEYYRDFLDVLERLIRLRVSILYPGHGPPIPNADTVIRRTRDIVLSSTLI
jgi:glyoxylase-like metal-dependent hydrolase (beta-lactamase superfamily II)